MKKITILTLFLTMRCICVCAQSPDTQSLQRAHELKQTLLAIKLLYDLRPGPQVVSDEDTYAVLRPAWSNANINNTPSLPAAQIRTLGQNLKASTVPDSNSSILEVTLAGDVILEGDLRPFADSCTYQSFGIECAHVQGPDSLTMIVSEPFLGMRLLVTANSKITQIVLESERIMVELSNNEQAPGSLHTEFRFELQSQSPIKPGAEISVALVPVEAYRYHYVEIPLNQESIGRQFTMQGVNVTLTDHSEGNVIFAADTLDMKTAVEYWQYVLSDSNGYWTTLLPIPFPLLSNEIPLGTGFQPASYAQWLKMGGYWEALSTGGGGFSQEDLENMWAAPTADEAARYHAAVGHHWSTILLAENEARKLTPQLLEQIVAQYPDRLKECSEDLRDAPDNDSLYVRTIAKSYLQINLEPHFQTIFRSAQEQMSKKKNKGQIALHELEYLYDFETQHQLPPLEKSDLKYLLSELPLPTPNINKSLSGLWYKLPAGIRSFIFYAPGKEIDLSVKLAEINIPIYITSQ